MSTWNASTSKDFVDGEIDLGDEPEPTVEKERETPASPLRENIPIHTQLYWYDFLEHELEDCIFDFVTKHAACLFYKTEERPVSGWKALEKVVCFLEERYPSLPDDAFVGSRDDLELALSHTFRFRQRVEHRLAMDQVLLDSALRLPSLLKDDTRAAKLDMITDAIRNDFQNMSSADVEAAHNLIFMRHVHQNPQLDLLSQILDGLLQSTFNWAKRTKPESIPADKIYKSYEPCYWFEKYSNVPSVYRRQDEASKLAFPDRKDELMHYMFKTLKELRNDFVHRNELFMERESQTKCSFWVHVCNAVQLALLLGDRARACEIDILVRAYVEGISQDAVRRELGRDGVEGIVERLLKADTRHAVFAGWEKDPHAAEVLRGRWIVIDVLRRGEEQFLALKQDVLTGRGEDGSEEER